MLTANASITVVDGGFISAVAYLVRRDGVKIVYRLTTVRVTKDLLSLRIPVFVDGGVSRSTPLPMALDVAWPAVAGATHYTVSVPFDSQTVPAPETSAHFDLQPPPEAEFQVGLAAHKPDDDGQGTHFIGFGYSAGNKFMPGGAGKIALDKVVAALPGHLTVTGISMFQEVDHFDAARVGPGLFRLGTGSFDFSQQDSSAALDFVVPSLPELPLSVSARINPFSCGAVELSGIFTDVSALTLDPERLARRIDSEPGTWALGPGELGDALVFEREWADGDDRVAWLIHEPPAASGATAPPLAIPEAFGFLHTAMPHLATLIPVPQPADVVGVEGYQAFFEHITTQTPYRLERRYRDPACDPSD